MYGNGGTVGGAAAVAGGGAALAATGATGLGWAVLASLVLVLGGVAVVRLSSRKKRV